MKTLWLVSCYTIDCTTHKNCGLFKDKAQAESVADLLRQSLTNKINTTTVTPISLFSDRADFLSVERTRSKKQQALDILSRLTDYDLEILGITQSEILMRVMGRQHAPIDKKHRHAYLIGYENGFTRKSGDTTYNNPYNRDREEESTLADAWKTGLENGMRDKEL